MITYAMGIKNGFCIGIDISSANKDIVYSDDCCFIVNGIVITVGPFYLIIGEFTENEG